MKYRCPKVSQDHEIKTISVKVVLIISLVSYVQRLRLGEKPEAMSHHGFLKFSKV